MTATITPAGLSNLPRVQQVPAWLDLLAGSAKGVVGVSLKRPNVPGLQSAFSRSADTAAQIVAQWDQQGGEGCYLRLTTLKEAPDGGRGNAQDSRELLALALDIDLAGPAHKGDKLPATPDEARECVADLPTPTLWIDSGHGVYPVWLLDEPLDIDTAGGWENVQQVVQRWHKVARDRATQHGWKLDNTSDLARVLRIPGTMNRKDKDNPVPCGFLSEGCGKRYSWQNILEHLATIPSTEPEPPRPVAAEPVNISDAYVTATIKGALHDLDELAGLPEGERNSRGWGWDTGTLAAACQLVRAANSSGGAYPLQRAEADFLKYCPTGGGFTRKNVAHKWQEAVEKVGSDTLRGQLSGVPELAEFGGTAPAYTNKTPTVAPLSLAKCEQVFAKWLGTEYDLDALRATLATAAAERLDGDPLWLLLISGPGNAKTETVSALQGAGALITSTISSAGALLSATSRKERTPDATGGLLRKLGDHGLLVIKDFTSVLSMDRTARGEVLAALREVYDGRWSRNVGTDGGRTLDWQGRLGVIGAVTSAWDTAHEVVASMGDRFVLLRMDSTTGRFTSGRRAMRNTGQEDQMRRELAEAAAGVLAGMTTDIAPLTDDEIETILAAANLTTLARTAVEYDYRGDVIDAAAAEMPTRFAKQLVQMVRGGLALGMLRAEALRLAVRCARDSMPPLRLAILEDLAVNPDSTPGDVRHRLNKPRSTVDHQLQALHMLELVEVDEVAEAWGSREVVRWRYRLAERINPGVLYTENITRNVGKGALGTKEEGSREEDATHPPTNISGDVPPAAPAFPGGQGDLPRPAPTYPEPANPTDSTTHDPLPAGGQVPDNTEATTYEPLDGFARFEVDQSRLLFPNDLETSPHAWQCHKCAKDLRQPRGLTVQCQDWHTQIAAHFRAVPAGQGGGA